MMRAPKDRTALRRGRPLDSGEERGRGSFRPAAAFILTSSIVAAGLTAAGLIGLYGPAGFDPGRDSGFVLVAFSFAWAITILAGVTIGLPILIGLRRLGLDRRLGALLAAGLVAGVLVSVVVGTAIAGPVLRGSAFVVALGAGAGLSAGALWWRLAVRLRSGNG